MEKILLTLDQADFKYSPAIGNLFSDLRDENPEWNSLEDKEIMEKCNLFFYELNGQLFVDFQNSILSYTEEDGWE